MARGEPKPLASGSRRSETAVCETARRERSDASVTTGGTKADLGGGAEKRTETDATAIVFGENGTICELCGSEL